jgi:hypothetical protein
MTHTRLPWLLSLLCFGPSVCLATEPTVASAARAFRIEMYQRYRQDRPRYDELRRLEAQLSQQWSEAGRPAEKAADLIAWYDQARLAIGTQRALPEWPELTALASATPTPPAPALAPASAPAPATGLTAHPVSVPTAVSATPDSANDTLQPASPVAAIPLPGSTTSAEPAASAEPVGSPGVGRAIGRALWTATVDTMAGK